MIQEADLVHCEFKYFESVLYGVIRYTVAS